MHTNPDATNGPSRCISSAGLRWRRRPPTTSMSSKASSSSIRSSTATTAGSSWRPTAGSGSPRVGEMIQGNRGDRKAGALVGLHYHLHQADYFGACPRGRPGWCSTTSPGLADRRGHAGPRPGAGRRREAHPPGRLTIPPGRGPRVLGPDRHDHHVPGRRLLQPGRRAGRGLERPGRERRLGRRRAGAVQARPGQPAAVADRTDVAAPRRAPDPTGPT